jgi:hypothetical protein
MRFIKTFLSGSTRIFWAALATLVSGRLTKPGVENTCTRPVLDVTLSVYRGQVYGVSVLCGTGYPDVDATVVKWIQSNWKTAPWFGVGTQSAISFDIDPTLRQVHFETRAGFVRFAIDFDSIRLV